ncbi:MAG TPA: RagB/SusD family nutrient uptake outer membrane protein, partial [Fodinibius sp.]|nr:RagB/SusD family nutrient uptake outer membrane protein [Fodinibius sp.]
MKRLTYQIVLLFSIILVSSACKDISSVEAPYRISGDKVIKDAQTAEVVLKGVYSQFRSYNSVHALEFTSALGLTSNSPSLAAYYNEVPINNRDLLNIYSGNYKLIQETNLFLEKVNETSADKLGGEPAKANFLAEGHFIRALAHFNLLRLFGQHYDTNSEYGIILRKQAADEGSALPRSTVAESYQFILDELEMAITNLTQTSSFRANKDA